MQCLVSPHGGRDIIAPMSRFLPLLAVALVLLPACSDGPTRTRDTDGGVVDPGLDASMPPRPPECSADDPDSCYPGFLCAAVDGAPRCVPNPDRPPPGDGTDCSPCPAPGECRMSVCVQPSASGRLCEFDGECLDDELCIAGRCTHDPRIPLPCADVSVCPSGFLCTAGTCACVHTADCPIGLECMAGVCTPGPGGDACIADLDCPADYVCEAGRCRPATICDIENPPLAGTWDMTSTLHLREALPSWLSSFLDAVEEPFAFLGGTTTCIDWDGLPSAIDTAICDLVRPYVEMYLPPWAPAVFRAISDLNDVINTWIIEETMVLEAGGVTDAYRGTHTWNRVTFTYRDMPITGDPADIVDWRFSPSEFNASAVCGTFNIERHPIHVSVGSIIAWLVDAIVYEASEHRWTGLRDALTDVADGFCRGLSQAAEENIDYPNVGSTVMSICGGLVSAGIDAALDAVLNARVGADAITLRGSSDIGGPNTLRPGVWNGTLLGSGFSGEFEAVR